MVVGGSSALECVTDRGVSTTTSYTDVRGPFRCVLRIIRVLRVLRVLRVIRAIRAIRAIRVIRVMLHRQDKHQVQENQDASGDPTSHNAQAHDSNKLQTSPRPNRRKPKRKGKTRHYYLFNFSVMCHI